MQGLRRPVIYVLAEFAGPHHKALGAQFVEQLGMNQMYLTQIGLGWIVADARPVLDRRTHMGVAGDPQSRQQADAQGWRL